MKAYLKLTLTIALLSIGATISNASITGTDDSSATAYSGGWLTGTDGSITGDGFGAWTLTNGGSNSGFFLGDSRLLAPPSNGADINASNTTSFGMFGHTGETAEAFRSFNGGDLAVGQSFSIDIAVNFRNGNKGFDLRDSSDSVIFNLNIGGDDYVVNNAATGNGSIGNTYSQDTAFNLSFTQTSLSGGTWTIVRSGGVSDTDSGTFSGVANNIKLYISQTDNSDSQNNFFANNLSIVPEPSAYALAFGSLALIQAVIRRRQQ